MRLRGILAAAALLAAALAQGGPAASQPNALPADALAPDPSLVLGELPNGLRYVVKRTAVRPGAVSLRLVLDVGSYEEADDERGFAHFVEHLAFRRTRNFPEGEADSRLSMLGVTAGRDHNAGTGRFSTSYKVDLPSADADRLDLAFLWLRDVADGIEATPQTVDAERGVVIAELDLRATPTARLGAEMTRFNAPQARSTNRDPGGERAQISAASPERLAAFHRRWYRPSHAMVIAVGDLSEAELEARITAVFGGWTARGPAPARAARDGFRPGRGLEVQVVRDPRVNPGVFACRLRAPEGPTRAGYDRSRELVLDDLVVQVVDARLAAVAAQPAPPFRSASLINSDHGDFQSACLAVTPLAAGGTLDAMAAAQLEFERLRRHGISEDELDSAIGEARAVLLGDIAAGRANPPDVVADLLAAQFEADLPFISAEAELSLFNRIVERATPEEFRARLEAAWSGDGPFITLAEPDPPPKEAVLAAWSAGRDADVAAGPALASSDFAYVSFGTPGRLVRRETVADLQFVRLHFQNGLVVNFKPMRDVGEEVHLSLRIGEGRIHLPREDRAYAAWGASYLLAGGLGRHDHGELARLFRTRDWEFEASLALDALEFEAEGLADNLAVQLAVMAAYLSDPGFGLGAERLRADGDELRRSIFADPQQALEHHVVAALDPGGPYDYVDPRGLEALDQAQFARVLRPILAAGALELTVAGEVAEADLIPIVAETLGALPRRAPSPGPVADPAAFNYDRLAGRRIAALHLGAEDQAAAMLIYPAMVADAPNAMEAAALAMLAQVFEEALFKRIRDFLGQTYDPSVLAVVPAPPDQSLITVTFQSRAEHVEALIAEARAVAAALAADGVEAAALERARRPRLADLEDAPRRPGWWRQILADSWRDPELARLRAGYPERLKAVTPQAVTAAARRWLAQDPVVGVAYAEGRKDKSP